MKIPLPISMLAVTLGLIYVCMCPVLNPWLMNGMAFHPEVGEGVPQYGVQEIAGIKGQEYWFGNRLNGWLYRAGSDVILFNHGNAGNLSFRAAKVAALLKTGQSVFIYDYAGFGKSEGHTTFESSIADGCTAFDFVRSLGYPNIILYGESIGSGIAAEVANRRSAKALILDSAFTSLQEIAKEKILIFRLYPEFLMPKPIMIVKETRNLPVLILHGGADAMIPFHHAEELHAAIPNSTLVKLPHSSHNDFADAALMTDSIQQFLAKINQQ